MLCVMLVVRCGRKHCGGGKLVSVGLYELRHMWIHNTSLHRNTFYNKGRISMRTDREIRPMYSADVEQIRSDNWVSMQ